MLCRQHFIHYHRLMILETVAFIGVVFILLTLTQLGNEFRPHNPDIFFGYLLGFTGVFGLLYIGHSFPAFRSKERTINYLMVPASVFEKFVFEVTGRIGLILVLLPVLYWITFHLQGLFFAIFSNSAFEFISLRDWAEIEADLIGKHNITSRYVTFTSMAVFGFVLAFTGSAMFSKQPLVKALFSLTLIVICFVGYAYIVVEHLGVGTYNPPESAWLFPMREPGVNKFITVFSILSSIVMLFVAYRKLKEREV